MKKTIIILFVSAILILNFLTYKKIQEVKDDQIDSVIIETTQTTSRTTTQTTSTTRKEIIETSELIIETTEKLIEKEIFFIPSPTPATIPENHIKNMTNFDYAPDLDIISFDVGSKYTQLRGIITFRGNNFRSQAAFGTPDIKEAKLRTIWSIFTGNIDIWTGVGWTGQPLIVQWPEQIKKIMNINYFKKNKNELKEVIYATLDGKIYFLDLDDGEQTRDPINLGFPHKGTASLDPRGYPLLYAGQGIDKIGEEKVEIGFRIYNLIDQSLLFFLNGKDPDAERNWHAFDSSAIIDAKNDTVYEPGENGVFYKMDLNTDFDINNAKISIDPIISKYRYYPSMNDRQGIENSIVTYENYGFFADNSGFIQCLNLNTLEPIWANDLKEDTDASIVAEEKNGDIYLYVGSEVDFQGVSGSAYLRKVDGRTGEFIWQNEYLCGSTGDINGGILATPVLGIADLSDYLFVNIAKIDQTNQSLLVALDKNTGEEIWRYVHNNYSWSSPLLLHSSKNLYYLIQCDSIGQVILFDAQKGTVLDVLDLETNIEGSPAFFENKMVIGTRGQKIFGIEIY